MAASFGAYAEAVETAPEPSLASILGSQVRLEVRTGHARHLRRYAPPIHWDGQSESLGPAGYLVSPLGPSPRAPSESCTRRVLDPLRPFIVFKFKGRPGRTGSARTVMGRLSCVLSVS